MNNSEKPRIMTGQQLLIVLCNALGINCDKTRRIIVDAEMGDVVKVYVESFGDKRLDALDWPNYFSNGVRLFTPDKPDEGKEPPES